MKKRKLLKNKLFNVFLSAPLISLPALGLVSCDKGTASIGKKESENLTSINLTYNGHEYKINYFEETPDSDKQVVLFLHGFIGNSWQEYEKLLDIKGRNYTMIGLDYPGTGDSPYHKDTDEAISMVMCAGIVKEFIKAKKLNDVVLFGQYIGGGLIPLVMQDTSLSIKKGLLLGPFNPYAVKWFVDKLRDETNPKKIEEIGIDLNNTLYALNRDARDPNKKPEDALGNALFRFSNEIRSNVSKIDPTPWFSPNLEWIAKVLATVLADPDHLYYKMFGTEIFDQKYARTTLLDAFKTSKDKLTVLSSKDDYRVPIQSIQKMKDDLGIPIIVEDTFNYDAQDGATAWNKINQFIYDQVDAL